MKRQQTLFSMNIYVGNLDYHTEEDELSHVFAEHGEVSKVTIIKDQFTGRGKGFGFVEMADDSEARAAIEQVHQTELRSRTIIVNEAKPKKRF